MFVPDNLKLTKSITMSSTYDEAQLFVVSGVHGLALLNAAAVVGLTLNVKSDPAQLEDDVPLSLYKHRYESLLIHSLILVSQSQHSAIKYNYIIATKQ